MNRTELLELIATLQEENEKLRALISEYVDNQTIKCNKDLCIAMGYTWNKED